MEKLFADFKQVSAQEWKNQIVKDLKGIAFDTLVWKKNEHTHIQPFYTHEDVLQKTTPIFEHSSWDVCEYISVGDEKKANQQALKALEGGASGLVFYINKKINTKELVQNISLEHIYTQFVINHKALHLLEDLKDFYGKKNTHDQKVKCFICFDFLYERASSGAWQGNKEQEEQILASLPSINVQAHLYQEAGAHTVTELALALAHTNEYIHLLSEKNTLQGKTIHLTFSVGSDFFSEIAKLRAFRKILALLQKQYEINLPLHLHAQTARWNKSPLDAYNNMLRTTTEAMSAVLGGCDSLLVLPYNQTFAQATDFSYRMALNQQHILKDESYLDKVADIGAGSYYIEHYTNELAQKAWDFFKEIEQKGGYIACLESGFIQKQIQAEAELLKTSFNEGKTVLVGVNKYQNKSEENAQNKKTKTHTTSPNEKAISAICLGDL
ncbi:MAG: hypothetical protein JST67_09930 [Bacteroidetes bacterium]|nr:hypothetical protein [Bacteroidota bacterium]